MCQLARRQKGVCACPAAPPAPSSPHTLPTLLLLALLPPAQSLPARILMRALTPVCRRSEVMFTRFALYAALTLSSGTASGCKCTLHAPTCLEGWCVEDRHLPDTLSLLTVPKHRLAVMAQGQTMFGFKCGQGAGHACTSNHELGVYQTFLDDPDGFEHVLWRRTVQQEVRKKKWMTRYVRTWFLIEYVALHVVASYGGSVAVHSPERFAPVFFLFLLLLLPGYVCNHVFDYGTTGWMIGIIISVCVSFPFSMSAMEMPRDATFVLVCIAGCVGVFGYLGLLAEIGWNE